jgi:hypothetical protein
MVSLLLLPGSVLMGQSGELQARGEGELLNGYELRTGGKLFRQSTAMRPAVFVAQLPLKTVVKEARLAGVFDFDGDGQPEVFLTWRTSPNNTFIHHFQVYRMNGQDAALLGQFAFEGGPMARIAFYQPQGTADTPKVVFDVMGGAMWGTWYLLSLDGKSTQKLGSGTGYHFIDLEKNGIYNLVAYQERPFEPICTAFGYMSGNPGLYPEIFRKKGTGYTQIWPPADWLPYDFQLVDQLQGDPVPILGKRYAVMAALYDIDRDGAAEIVALTDTVQRGDTNRMLEVYKVSGGDLTLRSQVAVSHPGMAVVIYGIRRLRQTRQAVLLFADPRRDCTGGADYPSLSLAAGFDFRQGHLMPVWRRKFDQFYPYMPAALTDVDRTGEEEMTFPDRAGVPFLTLRRESEFIAPPAKVLCAIGCPPFCSDAYTKGPPCGVPASVPETRPVPRRIVVSILDRKLALMEGGRVVRIYPVAVGAAATPSPSGSFTVVERVTHPAWYKPGKVVPPGKRNPLGTRWIGLSVKGYGIHGTSNPRSIGRRASHGCIRLRNADVEELFGLVTLGDAVELRAERMPEEAGIFGVPVGQ